MWNLISIFDPLSLPGESIYKITNTILNLLKIEFVFLSDLSEDGTNNLVMDGGIPVINIAQFLERVLLVKQFDWGDFFYLVLSLITGKH